MRAQEAAQRPLFTLSTLPRAWMHSVHATHDLRDMDLESSRYMQCELSCANERSGSDGMCVGERMMSCANSARAMMSACLSACLHACLLIVGCINDQTDMMLGLKPLVVMCSRDKQGWGCLRFEVRHNFVPLA
jgi:hypothetical protein